GKAPLGWAELDLVFPSSVGTVWSRSVLRRAFNDLQDAAEVGRIKLYATRSTHGSLLADAGVNLHALAERLGHTDPRFPAKVYLRGSSSTHRAVAEQIGAILGSSLVAEGTAFRSPAEPTDANSGAEPSRECVHDATSRPQAPTNASGGPSIALTRSGVRIPSAPPIEHRVGRRSGNGRRSCFCLRQRRRRRPAGCGSVGSLV